MEFWVVVSIIGIGVYGIAILSLIRRIESLEEDNKSLKHMVGKLQRGDHSGPRFK